MIYKADTEDLALAALDELEQEWGIINKHKSIVITIPKETVD